MEPFRKMKICDINTEFQDMDFGPEGRADVKKIAAAIRRGEKMPPILVSKTGFLQDGRHRLAAYKMLGFKEVAVEYGHHPAAKVNKRLK